MLQQSEIEITGFNDYLKKFIQIDNLYQPIDLSPNYYRHFGIRKLNSLFLDFREVLYLFDKNFTCKDLEIMAYFELKNNDYNILNIDEKQLLFNKTKHFNREKELPIAELVFVNRNEDIVSYLNEKRDLNIIYCVKGVNDYCFVQSNSIVDLNLNDLI